VQGFVITPQDTILDEIIISSLIPHRERMLLIREVVIIGDNDQERAMATLDLSHRLDLFEGHFPGWPILPGIFSQEALAQLGAISFLFHHREEADKKFAFLQCDMRWRMQVKPNARLRLETSFCSRIGGAVKFRGKAYLNGDVAAEGIFIGGIV